MQRKEEEIQPYELRHLPHREPPFLAVWDAEYYECRTGLCRPRNLVTREGSECPSCSTIDLRTPPRDKKDSEGEDPWSPPKSRMVPTSPIRVVVAEEPEEAEEELRPLEELLDAEYERGGAEREGSIDID